MFRPKCGSGLYTHENIKCTASVGTVTAASDLATANSEAAYTELSRSIMKKIKKNKHKRIIY